MTWWIPFAKKSNTQIKLHIDRLEELEYLTSYYGSFGKTYEYTLAWDGEGKSKPHLCGLIDVEHLRKYDSNLTGANGNLAPPLRRAPRKVNSLLQPV